MNGNPGENAYTIIETLQKSRQFCVYKARNYFSGKIVTIKTNEQRYRSDADQVRQLRDEAETGLRLKHPHIRETIGVFEDGGTVYMVSEFLEGDLLNDILCIPQVDISFSQAIKWTLQLLDALAYAHKHQILHLNLNPSNIVITPDYDLKLFGFGKSPHSWKNADADKQGFHPVLFAPPEVFREENPDERSDLYSVGVLAYLLLQGKLPWKMDRWESPSGQKQQTLSQYALKPDQLIPDWLFNILNKALMPDPSQRFASAIEMREAIANQRDIPYESGTVLPQVESVLPIGAKLGDNQFSPYSLPDSASKPQQTPDLQDSGARKPSLMDTQPGEAIPSGQRPTDPGVRSSQPTVETPGINIPIKSKAVSPEVKKMQKTFKILAIISLLILVYILFKYVIIKDKPIFSRVRGSNTTAKAIDPDLIIPNRPIQMISISGETAVIGNNGLDAKNNEYPLQEVPLASYMISPLELTREQWAMVKTDYAVTDEDKNLPITKVSFDEAVEYCNEKSLLDGLETCYEFLGNGLICDFTANGYRLPTEAEWEYAAKSKRRDNFSSYSGSSEPETVAWYSANSGGNIHPVGQKMPDQAGVYDLSGNAAEWVWNWYAPYSRSMDTPFAGPDRGTDKVVRGGSYKDRAGEIRVTNRAHAKPFTKADYIGFRVVRTK